MDPVTEAIQLIRKNPGRANALADQWQAFINTYARESPEILTINSKEEFYRWVTQHPEKNIDINIWSGKEIIAVYGEKTKVYANMDNDPAVTRVKKEIDEQTKTRQGPWNVSEDIQRQSWERFANEYPEKAEAYARKDDDDKNDNVRRLIKDALEGEQRSKIQTPPREFFNRGIGRAPSRLGGRLAVRTGSMAGRLASRLAVQAGAAVGRAAVSGIAAAAGNPVGLIVIGVIILIVLIVFLIIMLAGGGGGTSPGRLYECSSGFDFATSTANCSSGPDVDCIDPDGKTILVPDGNTCATNAATFYSAQEGIPITASCVDKCVDSALTKICSPDSLNNCPATNFTCQGLEGTPVSGAGSKTFCIQYVTPTPTPPAGSTPTPIGSPTPTPNLLGIAEKSFVLLHSSVNQTGILKEPKEGVKLSVEEILEAETDSGWVYVAKTIPDLNNVTFWFSITKIQNNVGLVYGIADIKNNNYYSGLLPGGEIEAGKFGDNYGIIYYDFDKGVKYKAAEVRQINALGTIELNVNLPWPSPINPKQKYVYSDTLLSTGYPIWESGDGVIPLNADTLSWYLSFIFTNGVWMDIQKFNVKTSATFGSRAANHRWGAFILEKAGGGLPADTIGVWWQILDQNNNPQAGGFTNFDMKKGGLRFTFLQDHSEDFKIVPIETYNSGNKVYLRKWKFVDSSLGVDLLMETNIANQENNVLGNFFYEGGIKVFHPGGPEIGTGMYEATHSE